MKSFVLLLAVLSFQISVSLGFAPSCGRSVRSIMANPPRRAALESLSPFKSPTTTALYAEVEPDTGGMKRGLVIMAVVLTVCVWGFTIPVELRRARWCSAEEAEIYPQCYTATQWVAEVQDYYKGGGGIKFDFSIDPGTLEENEEFRKSLLGQ